MQGERSLREHSRAMKAICPKFLSSLSSLRSTSLAKFRERINK